MWLFDFVGEVGSSLDLAGCSWFLWLFSYFVSGVFCCVFRLFLEGISIEQYLVMWFLCFVVFLVSFAGDHEEET